MSTIRHTKYTIFLITWHNLQNTSLSEEHAEDSVASFFLVFVDNLERFDLLSVHGKQQKRCSFNILFAIRIN